MIARCAWIVLLASGCVDHASSPTCKTYTPPATCVVGGLAGMTFDAATTWTFDGTATLFGQFTPSPFTFTTTIARDGTGCDQLSMKGEGPDGSYIDDTWGRWSSDGATSYGFYVCVGASGALEFHESDTNHIDSPTRQTIDGTLVHS